MAKKEKTRDLLKSKEMNSLLDYIDQGMTDLYSDTYLSQNTNKKDLEDIHDKIDDSIDSIVTNSKINTDISGMSRLFMKTKLSSEINSKDFKNKLEEMFEDRDMLGQLNQAYFDTKTI
jgi:hypothetical protein